MHSLIHYHTHTHTNIHSHTHTHTQHVISWYITSIISDDKDRAYLQEDQVHLEHLLVLGDQEDPKHIKWHILMKS